MGVFTECREPLYLFVKVVVMTWGREEFVPSGGSEERRVTADKQPGKAVGRRGNASTGGPKVPLRGHFTGIDCCFH